MKEVFIERREKVLRVAIKDNGNLSECYIEEESKEPVAGELYKAVVKKIVPAVKGAFLDIGEGKEVYMQLQRKVTEKFKLGDELIVEVLKEPIGKKSAKVTSHFTIAGKFLVIETNHKGIKISKKINNKDFEKNLLDNLEKPEEIGITIRTLAENASTNDIQKELDELYNKYKEITREAKYSLNLKKLHDNNGLLNKVIRENSNNKIVVDNEEDYELLKESNLNVEFHNEIRTIFDYYDIEKEILSLRNSRVNLKCGGNIVIEKTEAMYVIDVNSGKNISGRNKEKNAEETNIEAAKEILRQIKLRNLSGIIVVDFIDIYEDEAREKIISILRTGLEADKQKSTVYNFTQLGLIQIARSRIGKSIDEYIEESCIRCHGLGKILKLSYIELLLKNEIIRWELESKIKDFHINLNKIYEEDVRGNIFEFLQSIGAIDLNIYLTFNDNQEGYSIEPLIFKNQINNFSEYLVKNIEKY
ncbi:MAG: ribonuclease E/G [Sarcina sp.]